MSTPTPRKDGKSEALDELMPVVFDELRQLARRHLAREAPGHTLQPTALVHEVYLRLVASKPIQMFDDRTRFFACAARLMREILVDHARARGRSKRGGGAPKNQLDDVLHLVQAPDVDLTTVLAVDEALTRLETVSARQSRIVELRYFSGLTVPEIAVAMDLSKATVERDWAVARHWLAREIKSLS